VSLVLVSHTSELKNEYGDFKDLCGEEIGLSRRRLLRSIQSLPISTAECECGFSRMNLICTPLRSDASLSGGCCINAKFFGMNVTGRYSYMLNCFICYIRLYISFIINV